MAYKQTYGSFSVNNHLLSLTVVALLRYSNQYFAYTVYLNVIFVLSRQTARTNSPSFNAEAEAAAAPCPPPISLPLPNCTVEQVHRQRVDSWGALLTVGSSPGQEAVHGSFNGGQYGSDGRPTCANLPTNPFTTATNAARVVAGFSMSPQRGRPSTPSRPP